MEQRDMSMLYSLRRTMLGPCLGHIRAMFWLFLQYLCFWMHEMDQIFSGKLCMLIWRILFNIRLWETYRGHVWSILGLCFGNLYNMFASTWLKWLKFSPKSHAYQIKILFDVYLLGPYWGHVWALSGTCFGLFQQYICFYMTEIAYRLYCYITYRGLD